MQMRASYSFEILRPHCTTGGAGSTLVTTNGASPHNSPRPVVGVGLGLGVGLPLGVGLEEGLPVGVGLGLGIGSCTGVGVPVLVLESGFTLEVFFAPRRPARRVAGAGGVGPAVAGTVSAEPLTSVPVATGALVVVCGARRLLRPPATARDGEKVQRFCEPAAEVRVRRSPLFLPPSEIIFGGVAAICPAAGTVESPSCKATAV